jgi:hypothetical protein
MVCLPPIDFSCIDDPGFIAQKPNFEPISDAACLQFTLTALSFAILV